ncbi:MAG: hypothetical protein LAT51_05200 [Flavobacteriaceae bacterium]|nr:hypothetical protein [Flavobacteriaceae bacterium]
MKNYFFYLSLFCFIAFTSCSSDDDDAVATSLTIAGSAEQIGIGENINFTVENDLGENKTEEATINVNNTPIEGNVFASEETGNYLATATFEDLTSNTFEFSVTNFREYEFNQALVVYQGYINEEIEGVSVDGYAYIVLSYNGQSILENQQAIDQSENQMGFIIVTQEDENGLPYLPGESVETEQLVNTFLLKENGTEEEYTNQIEDGNYSVEFGDINFNSEFGGNASCELNLVFDEFEEYNGVFDGEFIFVDASGAGGGGNPEERPFKSNLQLDHKTVTQLKSYLNK